MNDDVQQFVSERFGGNALDALIAIANQYEIAIAYVERDTFEFFVEDERGEPLTDEEWRAVAAGIDFGSEYDEFTAGIENGDDGYIHNSFMRQALDDAEVPGPDGGKWSQSRIRS